MKSRRRWLTYVRSLVILAGFLLFTALLHLPHDAEHWSADFVTSMLSARLPGQHPDIALVYVTNATLDRYPYVSPIDRGLLSTLIQDVDRAGAKVIGLDVVLDRRTEPAKDAALRDAIRHTRAKMVLGVVEEAEDAAHVQAGFLNGPGDGQDPATGHVYFGEHISSGVVSDHVVRTMAEPDGASPGGPSFAEALAHAHGTTYRPASPTISWLLRPTNGSDVFLTLAAEDVMGTGRSKLPVGTLLRDKIVLIGGNFDDRDQHLTPLSAARDDVFTGLFIHAQILAQLLASRSVAEVWAPIQVAGGLAFGLAGFWLGRRSGHRHLWLELGIVASLVLVGILCFTLFRLIVPYNLLLIACLAGAAAGHYGKAEPHGEAPTE